MISLQKRFKSVDRTRVIKQDSDPAGKNLFGLQTDFNPCGSESQTELNIGDSYSL